MSNYKKSRGLWDAALIWTKYFEITKGQTTRGGWALFKKLSFKKPMRKIPQTYCAVIVISLLIILEACDSTPKIPVNSIFLGETISTTVDSEVARYYLENYLQGSRLHPVLDVRIGELYKHQKEAIPTREELKKISERFSVDFAALFLADRLWADENNRKIQNLFNQMLNDKKSVPNLKINIHCWLQKGPMTV